MDTTDNAQEPILPISPQNEEREAPESTIHDRMREFLAAKEENAEAEKPAPEQAETQQTENPGEQVDADAPKEPKAKAKWGELKKAKEELDSIKSTRLPTMEKELEELRADRERLSKVDPTHYEKQIAEKEQAIADYEKKLAVYDIQKSKQFQEAVIQPLQKIGADSARLAQTYGISAEELNNAFTIADPRAQFEKLNELMTDFDPIHKAKVFSMVEKAQEVYEKAGEMEKNAFEAKKEMEFLSHQEAEKQKGERTKKLSVSAEAVKKQMMEHLPFLKDETVAKDVFAASLETDDPTMTAYNAYAGQALKHAVKETRALTAKVKELEGELAKRAALGVKAGGNNGLTTPAVKPSQPEGGSLWERGKAMGLTAVQR